MCSARPEARVNEPASVLKIEFFSARFAPRVNELVSDRNMEFFSDKPEAIAGEAVGAKVQEVVAPACKVQETGVVLEA
ncbi:MAG TPA: hypothetical protein VNA15_03125 [Candidatus Angelobacter sp.]|nr:hypothetical protein [Candidatus Angelobacter sp.]